MLQIAIVATLLVIAAGFAYVSSRTITAAADRDELGRHRFLSGFASRRNLSPELLIQTYEALARRTNAGSRALGPATRLREDLGLSLADVEDIVLLVAARCEGHIPTGLELDRIAREVSTVEELVDYLTPFVAVEQAA